MFEMSVSFGCIISGHKTLFQVCNGYKLNIKVTYETINAIEPNFDAVRNSLL